MYCLKSEFFIETKRRVHASACRRSRAWLSCAMIHVLLFALLIASLPQPADAAWQNLSGTLPGFGLSTTEKVGIIVGCSAVAAAVVLLIVHHKRANSANLSAPVSQFKKYRDETPLRPEEDLPATSPPVPGTLKAVHVDGTPKVVGPAPAQGSDLATLQAPICNQSQVEASQTCP